MPTSRAQSASAVSPQTSLRLGLGAAALLALGFAGLLLRVAQSGPGWEVPSAVVAMLDYGSIVALALLVGAMIALIHASRARTLPRLAMGGSSAALLLAGLWVAAVLVTDPAQWPLQRPVLSRLAEVTVFGLLFLSGPVFWLLGFWALPQAPCRRGIQAVGLAVVASVVVGIVPVGILHWFF